MSRYSPFHRQLISNKLLQFDAAKEAKEDAVADVM